MFGLGAALVRVKRFNRPNLVVEVRFNIEMGPADTTLYFALLSSPFRTAKSHTPVTRRTTRKWAL